VHGRRSAFALLLALAAAGCSAPGPVITPAPRPDAAAAQSLAFTDVTVIDVAVGVAEPGRTVVAAGGRIIAVGAADEVEVPRDATVIDGTGKFLIPGLFDMHVHLFHPFSSTRGMAAELTRAVKDGVLGVRDMGMPLDSIPRLRAVVDSRSEPVPRVWFSGPILQETDSHGIVDRIVVTDPGAALQVVETLAAAGVMAIKVHDLLSPELYAAVARAARSTGLHVVGHVPITMTTDQVLGGNQRSIEHLGQIGGCSRAARPTGNLTPRCLIGC
jgi:hypothetical protein